MASRLSWAATVNRSRGSSDPSGCAAGAARRLPRCKRCLLGNGSLCAGCFMIGGGGAAAWGIYDIVAWIGSLHQGKGLIETESFLLGLPLLGGGLCAIGPEFIVPRTVATWSDRVRTRNGRRRARLDRNRASCSCSWGNS